jgi:hypothetical protein
MDPAQRPSQQERIREFTLLIAQLAAQYGISDSELAAAAGGACAIARLLRQVMAQEGAAGGDDVSPELLVMVFDARLRQRVSVEQEAGATTQPMVLQPPAVSYQ